MTFLLRGMPLRLGRSSATSRPLRQWTPPLMRPVPPRSQFSTSRLLWEAASEASKVNEPIGSGASNSPRNKEQQRPWHRADESEISKETPPTLRNADATKGRVLTTPTRLLKFILPLPVHPDQSHLNESPPKPSTSPQLTQQKALSLALLVHPQQPLSYVASLLQAELPLLRVGDVSRMPTVHFRADADASSDSSTSPRPTPADVAPQKKDGAWVRWSGSTEVGDFIRDAARGREFIIEIEGMESGKKDAKGEDDAQGGEGVNKGRSSSDTGGLRVLVPSFKDRTYWMRRRLRTLSKQIDELGKIKKECDLIAHRSAHRIAKAGFGMVGAWWVLVYYISFHTDLTWDTMEPITYLAGLVVIMAGYWYFLYVSRDLSYKAALNVTVTRRQHVLYRAQGFDMNAWERLLNEANTLRGEIRVVAEEYAVDWDEDKDLGGEEVREVLEEKQESENGEKETEGTKEIKKEERLEKVKEHKEEKAKEYKEQNGSEKNKA